MANPLKWGELPGGASVTDQNGAVRAGGPGFVVEFGVPALEVR